MVVGLGPALRRWRLGAGLTQEELGRAAGVERVTISMIETGERNPSLDLLQELTRALKTTPAHLMAEAEGLSVLYGERGDRFLKTRLSVSVLGTVSDRPSSLSLEEAQHPTAHRGERFDLTDALTFGRIYAVRMKGSSMAPAILGGDLVLLSSRARQCSGSECVVFFKSGRAICRQVYTRDHHLIAQSPNPAHPPMTIALSDVAACHRVIAVWRSG